MFPPFGALAMTDEEFLALRTLVKERIGIHLSEEKRSLLSGRLQKRVRELRLASFREYYERVLSDPHGQELGLLANQISTNHTYFLREKEHFDLFTRETLPRLAARIRAEGKKELRTWCAASSTGEEPYYLAILLMEYFGDDYAYWNAGLLATDISDKALAAARHGVYPADRVSVLPQAILQKYFVKLPDGSFEVAAKVKRELTYRRFNLTNEVFPFRQPFHVIFCRNVMIYFDGPTKEKLIRHLSDFLVPGGYLFIGHSETLGVRKLDFEFVQPAVYRKAGA